MVFRTNMTEETKDLKKEEAETSTEESTVEEKPEPQEEEEPLKKQEDEEKQKLEAALKKAEDQERRAIKLAEDKRLLEVKLEAKNETSESQDEDIPDWRIKEKEHERVELLSLAQKQIVDEFPTLQNDVEWDKFKDVHDKYGGPRSNTLDGIKEEYKGFLRMANIASQTQPSDKVVEDSGIGDTASQLKTIEEKPDALTRQLNDHERKAVVMLSQDKNISQAEAEKLWREKRAKIDEEVK